MKDMNHCMLCSAPQHGLLLCVSCERTMERIKKKNLKKENRLQVAIKATQREKTLSPKDVERINKEVLEC